MNAQSSATGSPADPFKILDFIKTYADPKQDSKDIPALNECLKQTISLLESGKMNAEKMEELHSNLLLIKIGRIEKGAKVEPELEKALEVSWQNLKPHRDAKKEAERKVALQADVKLSESDPNIKKKNNEYYKVLVETAAPAHRTLVVAIEHILAREGLSESEKAEDKEILKKMYARLTMPSGRFMFDLRTLNNYSGYFFLNGTN